MIPLTPLADGRFQLVPLEDRPDPTPEERAKAAAADRITQSALLREWKWSYTDLATAFEFGLKAPAERTERRFNIAAGGTIGGEMVFSRATVSEWRARLLALAAKMP